MSSSLFQALNERHLTFKEWAIANNTNCYRLYDRQVDQFPIAIDRYGERFCIHYFAPQRNQLEPTEELINQTNATLIKLFNVPEKFIYWRSRSKSKATRQYEKVGESKEFFLVKEYGVDFKVNLVDYVDTGLFLDHRETRQLVAALAPGKRLLNLFSYTASFSVHAAKKGAAFTKSVDLSNTYTEWGRQNFLLNKLSLSRNEVVRADCLKFLDQEIHRGQKYDLIVIDPPTISRSKKMDQLFDVQKDYLFLISRALRLLNPKGTIFFSTNFRNFVFDLNYFKGCQIEEITNQTIPIDFKDSLIHRCWKIN